MTPEMMFDIAKAIGLILGLWFVGGLIEVRILGTLDTTPCKTPEGAILYALGGWLFCKRK